MSFALPPELREFVDARVGSGEYGNTSEYLRELIRRDQQSQAALHIRTLIADGMGFHVPKGYIYAAMGFSALVEGLNMLARRRRARRAKPAASVSTPAAAAVAEKVVPSLGETK